MGDANQLWTTPRLVLLCQDKAGLLEQLQNWGLVPPNDGSYRCPKCSGPLILGQDASRIDGWRWRCPAKVGGNKKKKRPCGQFVEFRTGTFFAGSHLTIQQILGFVRLWVKGAQLALIGEDFTISNKTCVDWASFCREVLLAEFVDHPEKIGGPGKTVEIDESQFGRRKYHRGRRVNGQWVFGGYERGSGRVFMVTVPDRTAGTLLPLIQTWIHPGTLIISDCWKAYDQLTNMDYEHLKVNHSVTFKDPETGAHTNSIESSWCAAKRTMTSAGRKSEHIPGNLARYMFLKRCKEMGLDRTAEFLRLAGKVYDARRPQVEPASDDEITDYEDTVQDADI